jgi:hypothetical protein
MKATNDHVAQAALVADTVFQSALGALEEFRPPELEAADWRALVLGALEGSLEIILDQEKLTDDQQKLRVVAATIAKADTFRRLVESKVAAAAARKPKRARKKTKV